MAAVRAAYDRLMPVPIEQLSPFRLLVVKALPIDLGEVNGWGGAASMLGSVATMVFLANEIPDVPLWAVLLDGIPGIGGAIMVYTVFRARAGGIGMDRQRALFARCTVGACLAATQALYLVALVAGCWLAPALRPKTESVAMVAGALALVAGPSFASAAFDLLAGYRLRRREG